MVSSAPPTSTLASSPAGPFMPMSSHLYGSCESSASASFSLTTRRRKRWPSLTILRITLSILVKSSGLKGVFGSKS